MDDQEGASKPEFFMDSVVQFDLSRFDGKSILASLPECVVLVAPDGRIMYVSPDFYTLFRFPPEKNIIGIHAIELMHESETAARQRMRVGPNEKDGISPTTFRMLRGDGSSFLCEIASAPARDKDGAFVGLIAVMRDVTSNKQLEQSNQKNLESQEFLNHLLTLLYRPRDLKKAFEQVLEMIGIFMHASRVSLMESDAEGLTASMTMEWINEESPGQNLPAPGADLNPPDSTADAPAPGLVDKFVCIDYAETPSLRIFTESRGMLTVPGDGATPPDLQNLLAKWRLKSLAVLPVFGVDSLFGMLLIEYSHIERAWDTESHDLLRNITRTVSNAVARKQSEAIEFNQRVLVETLRDITSVVNSDFTFDQVLDYILMNLQRIVPHSASNILLMDDQNHLMLAQARGYPPEIIAYLKTLHQPVGQWKTLERVASTTLPLLVTDTFAEPNWVSPPGLTWVRSYLGAAIRSRGKLLGILNVDATQVNAFTQEHATRLQAFADQAAVAIENALLYQEAHRRADQMTSLYEIGLTLASGLELEQVLGLVHDQVKRVVPFDQFFVALYNHKTDIAEFPLFLERGNPVTVAPRKVSETPGLSGVVIKSRKTLYLDDLQDPQTAASYPIMMVSKGLARCFVAVPLIAREQVVGVISMQSYQPSAFTQEQVRLLETLANQAALAIDNASIFKEMKTLAITDPLTGLYNRRHFTALGQVEVERALRYERGLGVLMVDIDHFKKVNDTLGHATGDVVLEGVSILCSSQLRSSDIIGRYGGEEFAIVLPESSEERARSVAERIRAYVASNPILTPKGSVPVTISVGLSLLSPGQSTLEILLDRADRAMYQAKQAGRNMVKVFEEEADN